MDTISLLGTLVTATLQEIGYSFDDLSEHSNPLAFVLQPTKNGYGVSRREVEYCLQHLKQRLSEVLGPQIPLRFELRICKNSVVDAEEMPGEAYSIIITDESEHHHFSHTA